MIHPLKITSTLADETRFQIYEYMLQQKKYFNVQEIADKFSIHPNVARLHLTKLAEIQSITAEFVKTGKGGRPGRVYRINESGVELSFPRRDYTLLLQWLLEIVREFGDEGLKKGKLAANKNGQQSILNLLDQPQQLPLQERIQLLQDQAALIGYVAEVIEEDGRLNITFNVFNCPFQSFLEQYSATICELHESFLYGQVQALFGNVEFEQTTSMVHNCSYCKYTISNGNVSK